MPRALKLALLAPAPACVAWLFPTLLARFIESRPIWPRAWAWPQFVGASLFLISASLAMWCAVEVYLRVPRRSMAPIAAPDRLTARGPYAWCRNPMMLGLFGMIGGTAVFNESIAAAVYLGAVIAAITCLVRFIEEPRLRAALGGAYEEYCRRVPRWVPRRPR